MIPAMWVSVAAFAVGFGGGFMAQGWRMGEDMAELRLQHAEEYREAAQRVLTETREYKEKTDAAVKSAEARAASNKRDADSVRRELDGLRGDLATVPERIASASREAVNNYAIAATDVFERCAARYYGLAEKATGHASDVQTLIDAWPYNQPR